MKIKTQIAEIMKSDDYFSDDYFMEIPENILNELGWVEGDILEMVNNCDGSFSIKKIK